MEPNYIVGKKSWYLAVEGWTNTKKRGLQITSSECSDKVGENPKSVSLSEPAPPAGACRM